MLLNPGKNVNKKNYFNETSLICASINGHHEVIKFNFSKYR